MAIDNETFMSLAVIARAEIGGVVTTSYDPRGNVTAVDGATYPLRMEYDLKGRRTALTTTRDGESWDETRWTLDPATGLCLSKTYADGSTVSYAYTSDGLPARTTWPGGRWQENGYSAKREVVSTERSDGEETAFAYDAYSREIAVTNDSASIEYSVTTEAPSRRIERARWPLKGGGECKCK